MLSHKQALPCQQRLESAKHWLTSYKGRHLVKAYTRRNHIDLVCAIKDLRMLGVIITEKYEAEVVRSVADRIAQKRKSRKLYWLKWTLKEGLNRMRILLL